MTENTNSNKGAYRPINGTITAIEDKGGYHSITITARSSGKKHEGRIYKDADADKQARKDALLADLQARFAAGTPAFFEGSSLTTKDGSPMHFKFFLNKVQDAQPEKAVSADAKAEPKAAKAAKPKAEKSPEEKAAAAEARALNIQARKLSTVTVVAEGFPAEGGKVTVDGVEKDVLKLGTAFAAGAEVAKELNVAEGTMVAYAYHADHAAILAELKAAAEAPAPAPEEEPEGMEP